MGRAVPGPGDELPWRTVLDQAADPVLALDLEARFIYVNPAVSREMGYSREYLLQCHAADITHPEEPVVDQAAIEQLIAGPSDRSESEKRYIRADGSVVWKLVASSIIRDSDGEPLLLLSQTHNIDARRESELLWQRTLANAPIGMALLDLKGCWTEVNSKLCELLGYSRDELLSKHFTDLTYHDDTERSMGALGALIAGRQETATLEKRYRHKDGHPLWILQRISVVPGADGNPAYLVSQYETIGDPRMGDRHLSHMALHDPLTGLANRALLFDLLQRQLDELADRPGLLAVLLVDLDGLKPVNDNFGHLVGDELLTTTADKLLTTVRAEDTVARLGGDEFVVLTHVANRAAAESVRQRLAQCLRTEVFAADHEIQLRASIGLASTETPSTSPEVILHRADQDMYQHKHSAQRQPT